MKKNKKVEQDEKNTESCLSIEELIKLAKENNKLKLAKPLTDDNKEQNNTRGD